MNIRSLNEAVRDAMYVDKLDMFDLELTQLEERFHNGMVSIADIIRTGQHVGVSE